MNKSLIIAAALASSTLITTTAFANTYTVSQGDTLYSIAKAKNITLSELKSVNNLSSSTIRVGQILQLTATTNTSNVTSAETGKYIVVKGDTFTKIAKSYNLSVSELVKLNPTITNTSKIFVGQKIIVPASTNAPNAGSNVTSTLNGITTTYTIKTGDSLTKIASTYKTSLTQLMSINPSITNASKIYVGQKILVPSASSQVSPLATSTSALATKVITSGEKYLGARYLYGASVSRFDAFDCSSFTYRAFVEGANITLPRTSEAQSNVGTNVSLNSLQVGDLVFFDTDFNGSINHVGIYVGNGQMINAATSKGVSYASITSGYWKERLVKAQRVLK